MDNLVDNVEYSNVLLYADDSKSFQYKNSMNGFLKLQEDLNNIIECRRQN